MEYEIKDDPQGLPDHADGLRDGGLDEERYYLRKRPDGRPENEHDDASDEDSSIPQFVAPS